jgi:hypothetical protein
MLNFCYGETDDDAVSHTNDQPVIHILRTTRDKTPTKSRPKGINTLTSSPRLLTNIKSGGSLLAAPLIEYKLHTPTIKGPRISIK